MYTQNEVNELIKLWEATSHYVDGDIREHLRNDMMDIENVNGWTEANIQYLRMFSDVMVVLKEGDYKTDYILASRDHHDGKYFILVCNEDLYKRVFY